MTRSHPRIKHRICKKFLIILQLRHFAILDVIQASTPSTHYPCRPTPSEINAIELEFAQVCEPVYVDGSSLHAVLCQHLLPFSEEVADYEEAFVSLDPVGLLDVEPSVSFAHLFNYISAGQFESSNAEAHRVCPEMITYHILAQGWVHPLRLYKVWNNFILLWAIYSSFFTPLEFGFFRGLQENLFILDIAGQFAFLADIVVQFCLAYRDSNTYRMVNNRNRIALRYLKSGFFVDLLACLPWDLIYKMDRAS